MEPQPDPEPVPAHIWALVGEDLTRRTEVVDDDPLVTRYHELLDAAGYLRARLYERDGR